EFVFPAQSLKNGVGKARLVCTGLPSQHCDRALVDGKRRIRYHQLFCKLHLISEAETLRAGSEWVVEGEAPRLDLLDADPAVRTGKALAEVHRFTADDIYYKESFREMENALHRIGQPLLDPRFYHKPVHNDLNIMLDIFIQC